MAESVVPLPPFPLVSAPEGLLGMYDEAASSAAMDREHMIAGDEIVALEGKLFRQRYRLTGGEREYTQAEFQRHHGDAIAVFGGAEMSRVQFTPQVNAAFGGRKQVDTHYHGACAGHGCDNHAYLVCHGGKEYWLLVSSGGIPLHGQVTVLEWGAPTLASSCRGDIASSAPCVPCTPLRVGREGGLRPGRRADRASRSVRRDLSGATCQARPVRIPASDRGAPMSLSPRTRIQDVAAIAGVSMKTVSRVVNNEPHVREDTRLRVQAAIEQLQYRPHPSARSLAGQRTYLIALLYDNPSPNYVMEVLAGVLDACEAHHYNLVLHPMDMGAPDFMARAGEWLQHAHLDGLILTPPLTDHAGLLARLRADGTPYASISPMVLEKRIGVTLDEHGAAREIMRHLTSLGHRRIAHIKGHPDHGASTWRLSGYEEGLREAGLPLDPGLVVDGEFSFDSGARAAKRLLDMPQPPTAIFAANDDAAAGVISVAYQRGLSVPRHLSVCGFDDTPMSRQISPSLTTVRQPSRDMGRVAATELLRSVRDPGAGAMLRMPYTLQLRDSTGRVDESR